MREVQWIIPIPNNIADDQALIFPSTSLMALASRHVAELCNDDYAANLDRHVSYLEICSRTLDGPTSQ